MKKGFTLVELLGVIVILGIISILVVPVVNNMMIESREELAKTQEDAIIKAAKNWGGDNIFLLPDLNCTEVDLEEENPDFSKCDTITITLGQLMNEGFLDNQTIKDVNTNKIYSPATEITIGKKNNQHFYYLPKENIFDDEIVVTEGGPTIVLKGSSAIVEEANRDGESVDEPGVIVRDKNGNNIEKYTVTVTKTSEKGTIIENPEPITLSEGYTNFGFDTKTVANYKVVYKAIDNGKEAKMIRNVQVRDTTAPVISFVNNIEVAQSVQKDNTNKIDYHDVTKLINNITFIDPSSPSTEANEDRNKILSRISGVVVMDNSCGKSDMKKIDIKSTVPADGKLGSYSITYTITDKYGNKTKSVRNVKIVSG